MASMTMTMGRIRVSGGNWGLVGCRDGGRGPGGRPGGDRNAKRST
jgi:hypothetical protein